MDMDLATGDAGIAEHRMRVAFADRFGPLLSPGGETAPSRRTTPAAVTAVRHLFRVVGAAWRSLGGLAYDSREGLRSNEHDLAALGMKWPADVAYDSAVAEQVRTARRRRLAAGAITPPAPVRLACGHGTATGPSRATNGEAFARVGERLRVTPQVAAVGGGRQSGDQSGVRKP